MDGTFRALCGSGLALLLISGLVAQERAKAAVRFVDSIGVDVHMSYTDTSYGNSSLVIAKLGKLGVKHVRDGVNPSSYTPLAAQKSICNSGVDLLLNVGAPSYSAAALAAYVSGYKLPSGTTCINGFEGSNEQDTNPARPPWYTHWNSDYVGLVAAVPAGLPAIGPPLANIGNRSAVSAVTVGSYGNFHPYPAGQMPTVLFPSQSDAATSLFPDLPLQASETGYHTALNDHRDQPAIDYATGAKYIPRLLAESFNAGVYRTYLYELLDEYSATNSALQDQPGISNSNEQSAWGLVASDGTEKPAFTALANLIGFLSANSTTVASPSVMPFSLSSPATVHHVLLQKSAHVYDLLLWNDVKSWDEIAQKDITNTAVTVSLFCPVGTAATVYTPSSGHTDLITAISGVLPIAVPDEVVVVEFIAISVP